MKMKVMFVWCLSLLVISVQGSDRIRCPGDQYEQNYDGQKVDDTKSSTGTVDQRESGGTGTVDQRESGGTGTVDQREDGTNEGTTSQMEEDTSNHIACRLQEIEKMTIVSKEQMLHLLGENRDSPEMIMHLAEKADASMVDDVLAQFSTLDLSDSAAGNLAHGLIKKKGGINNMVKSEIEALPDSVVKRFDRRDVMKLDKESFDVVLQKVVGGGTMFDEDNMSRFDKNLLMGVRDGFSKYYRRIDNSTFNLIKPILHCLPVRLCKTIPRNVLLHNLIFIGSNPLLKCGSPSHREHLCGDAHACANVFLKKVLGSRNERMGIGSSTFSMFGGLKTCMGKRDMEDMISNMGCTDDLKDVDQCGGLPEKAAKLLLNECKPNISFEAANQADIDTLGPLVRRLPPSELRKIPTNVLCSSTTLNAQKCTHEDESQNRKSRTMRSVIAKRCASNDGPLTAAKIDELADMADVIPISSWKNASAADIRAKKDTVMKAAKMMKKKRGGIAAMRILTQKMSSFKDIIESEELMSTKSHKEVCEQVTNVTQDLGLSEGKHPHLPPSQSMCMAEKLKKNKPLDSWTKDDILNHGEIVSGFLANDIRTMSVNTQEDKLSLARPLCSIDKWTGRQLKEITRNLIVDGLSIISETDFMMELTVSDVTEFGSKCLMNIRPDEIAEASDDVCAAVCTLLGNDDALRCYLPLTNCSRLANICLKCLGKSSDSSEFDSETLEALGGNLLACLDSASINRIPDTMESLQLLRGMCMQKSNMDRIAIKVKAAIENDNITDAIYIETAGSMIGFLSEIEQTLLLETLSPHIESIAEMIGEISEDLEPIDEQWIGLETCCRKKLGTTAETARRNWGEGMKRFYYKVISENIASAAKRRKRATGTWTCADVQAAGSGIVSMTETEIYGMDVEEFTLCLEVFGSEQGWSSNQKALLLDRITVDIAGGSLCNMTSEQIQQLGFLSTSMSVADIECLTFNDDAFAALGALTSWSSSQLSALANSYLATSGTTAGTFTPDNIAVMGHILCGLSTSDIENIPNSVYGSSSAMIGNIKKCDFDKIVALKGLAVSDDAYGAIVNWTASVFNDVGIVLGGLGVSELRSVSFAAIEGWRTHAIAAMQPDHFKGVLPSQLELFSMEQVSAVTSSQREQLSDSQMSALKRAEGVEWHGAKTSGACQTARDWTFAVWIMLIFVVNTKVKLFF